MKAITMYQPWAEWVALGWKTIETRTHDRFRGLAGQTIAIHAGARFDRSAASRAIVTGRKMPGGWINATYDTPRIPRVVCVATVSEFRALTAADSRAAMIAADGLFGLVLTNVKCLARSVLCRGQQGVWTLPPEVEAEVLRQVKGT